MKLRFRELFWCFLFKKKFYRQFFFYNLNRYKKKLIFLDNLNLNQGSIVFDFGSNNGVITQYLYDKYSCHIYSFEPNPYCYLVQKNIFDGISKIKLFNKAVSKSNIKKKLYLHLSATHISNMKISESSSLEKKKSNISRNKFIFVNSVSINSIIKKFKYIDFIKIDIEGHEYKILPSIIKNIGKIGKIFCEMHGKDHRSEFKKDFNFWNKKINKYYNKKFFYW
jgi:FkbM family methyltransferase